MPGSVLKAGARKLIFENSPKLLIISVIYVVLVTVVFSFSVRMPIGIIWQDIVNSLTTGVYPDPGIITSAFRPAGVLLALLLFLLQPVLDVGFISYCLKINRAQVTDFKDLLNGFLFITKVIALFIFSAIFVFLWSLLLVVPGIVASYRYRLAFYILIDDPGKGALQCIHESKLLMHGKKLDLLTIDLSFIGWYILDFAISLFTPLPFAFPIVSVWLSPYTGLTRAAFYEEQVAKIAV